MQRESTIIRFLNELKEAKKLGKTLIEYSEYLGKDKYYFTNKMKAFKKDPDNEKFCPEIITLYEELKNISKLSGMEIRGMKVIYNRDEEGKIESYDIYYPIKDSTPFETTLTRKEAEDIFALYTYYGGNITARQVASEFPKYTLTEIKRIFRCFHLTKDSSFAAPHLLEELNEEQLAQYRINVKERAAFKYVDQRMERDFTNQIKKMACEINSLKNQQEVVKSLDNIDYKQVSVKKDFNYENKIGILCLSDLHVGAFNQPEGYLDLPNYNEQEINRRLDIIIDNLKHKDWDNIIVLNLGDNVDSYRKMTSSMSHQLPCIMTDKEIAQLYLKVMMRFFNQLNQIFSDISYYSIGSGNHSSTWGWLLDITLSQQLKQEFDIDCYVSNNEIDIVNINETSFLFLHGKTSDEKGQKRPFPLNLNDRTQCWFNDFFADTDLPLKKRKVVLKGDLHQYSINSVSSFDYINCPSVYASSTYIVSNFGFTPWGCAYLEVDNNGNYVSGVIKE